MNILSFVLCSLFSDRKKLIISRATTVVTSARGRRERKKEYSGRKMRQGGLRFILTSEMRVRVRVGLIR